MEDHQSASYTTLLSSSSTGQNNSDHRKTRKSLLRSYVRWAIKLIIWLIFIPWAAVMFFFPLSYVQNAVEEYISLYADATLYGATGTVLLAFACPVLFIALLAALYINLSDDEEDYHEEYPRNKNYKNSPGYSLWTFPVLVDGPFGVVTGVEFIGILLFTAAFVWGFIAYTIRSINDVSSIQSSNLHKCAKVLEQEGIHMASMGMFCLSFLFIPVARGSVILRFMDIPFEHAIRYHVWLGHLTILIFTLHGLSFVLAWTIEGNLLHQLLSWKSDGIAIFPGVIALTCGILMWFTALHPVRRKYFELFYYTHHLYIGFLVFFALHAGAYFFTITLGGILIFILDRFLRFYQSRKIVDIISVTSHPCRVIELVISKPIDLRYNAMSFIFINARELSLLQWHPFSVSSTPMDSKDHLVILIKVLGDWTMKLNDQVSKIPHGDENEQEELTQLCLSQIPLTVSVEGPYGHESPYYLMYTNLVLVAGGIGISPFLAIVRDILHRAKSGRSSFPRSILIIWAIKRSDELSLLPNMESTCPSFSNLLNLEIQVYITRRSEPTPMEEGETCQTFNSSVHKNLKRSGMSPLVGTGDKKWISIYIFSSIIGFLVVLGLLDEYYINPIHISNEWYKGLLLLACIAVSVVGVGGLVATLWHLSTRNVLVLDEHNLISERGDILEQNKLIIENKMISVQDQINLIDIKYGCRPNFKDIFESMEEKCGSIDVGVIVCGPPSLESSVAKEIRSRSFRRKKNYPIFHFHTHSFQL